MVGDALRCELKPGTGELGLHRTRKYASVWRATRGVDVHRPPSSSAVFICLLRSRSSIVGPLVRRLRRSGPDRTVTVVTFAHLLANNEQTISRSDVIWEGGPHRRVTMQQRFLAIQLWRGGPQGKLCRNATIPTD
jgi:hypothetical protein